MKHRHDRVPDLVRDAALLGIDLDSQSADEMLRHLEWVCETTKTHNLTAIGSVDEGIRLHVADSIAVVPEINDAPEGDLVDIGSGGGFPGVPLAILTGRTTTLLDSVGKKVRMVGEYADSQGLPIVIAPVRAEEYALSHAEAYAVAVGRAVSQLASLIELASPLLRPGGRLVALKGPVAEDELDKGDVAAGKCGMIRRSTRRFVLPGGGEERTAVAYEKTSKPAVSLPRRVGLAQKRPLS